MRFWGSMAEILEIYETKFAGIEKDFLQKSCQREEEVEVGICSAGAK